MSDSDGTRKQRLAKVLLLDELHQWAKEEEEEEQACTKREWAKPWLMVRDLNIDGINIYDEMERKDPQHFEETFRMSQATFYSILQRLEPKIAKQDTNMRMAISAKLRLQITLRFLACGASFKVLQDIFRVSSCTIGRIIPEVCDAIWFTYAPEVIQCPQTEERWLEVAKDFEDLWQYPTGLGAIDGKHVVCQSFDNSGSSFR